MENTIESQMPNDLVLVRHGLSEPNIIQRLEKHIANGGLEIDPETGEFEVHDPHIEEFAQKYAGFFVLKDEIYDRPDHAQRLSLEGVDQARVARQWLTDNYKAPGDFDGHLVSPFARTVDTAKGIGGDDCLWLPDFRITERDWGIYGATPREIRPDEFPHIEKMKDKASFYVRYPNGESILDVAMRFKDFVDTMSRDYPEKSVLAVSHGELMWAARYILERMLPQEFHEMDGDSKLRIGNCCIMICARTNPEDPEERSPSMTTGWMRMVDPVEPEKSPYDGEWRRLPGKRRFNGQQLGELTADTPRLILPS